MVRTEGRRRGEEEGRGDAGEQNKCNHARPRAFGTGRASSMLALIAVAMASCLELAFGYSFPYIGVRLRRTARLTELRMDRRDDEIQRLRRENEELRRSTQKEQAPNPLGALQKLFKPITDIVKPARKQNEVENMIDKALQDAPLPIKMFGGLMKGFAGMAGEMMQGAAEDIDRVTEAAERRVRLSAEASRTLGPSISVGAPVSQSFSSSNINGVSTKQVSLRMPVRGSANSGTLLVDATISNNGSISLKRCTVQTSMGSFDVGSDRDDDDNGIIDVVAK
eukprot:748965-Hanusia_phi.AAC.2